MLGLTKGLSVVFGFMVACAGAFYASDAEAFGRESGHFRADASPESPCSYQHKKRPAQQQAKRNRQLPGASLLNAYADCAAGYDSYQFQESSSKIIAQIWSNLPDGLELTGDFGNGEGACICGHAFNSIIFALLRACRARAPSL